VDIAQIADELGNSRKYRWLCAQTRSRIAAWAAERSKSQKEAVKRAKRKLHQVYGAYLADWRPDEVAAALARLGRCCAGDELRAVCRDVLLQHASTRERLPFLDALYPRLWAITGVPARITDVGCGLHPFSIPWMALPPGCEYSAIEMDERLVTLLQDFFRLTGTSGRAAAGDALVRLPPEKADVAFMLKMLPCLEQQENGCTARLLRDVNADHVVVSFPARSLGGRDKGMPAHYTAVMEKTLRQCNWPAARFALGNELFFILEKHCAGSGTRPTKTL
jgi:16S rRNA (guanine(1405)-N(7))-methyltransferase